MQAIVLAAGYATRLYPLTKNKAKPLLEIAGRPMLEHILERLRPLTEVERIHVVTNARFASDFEAWLAGYEFPRPILIVNDGTTTNETRLGAIGDVAFVLQRAGWEDDYLIVAGDNLFTFDLRPFLDAFHRQGTTVGLYRFPDLERVKQYSVAELDETGRIVSYIEKPAHPTTNLVGISLYALRREHIPLIGEYLRRPELNQDAPGYFIQWLCQQVPVYGFVFEGLWFDIGTHESLREAEEAFRGRSWLSKEGSS